MKNNTLIYDALQGIDAGSLPRLENCFTKTCIERVTLFIAPDRVIGDAGFVAYVDFKNGGTSGQQQIKAESFAELIVKVQQFTNLL